MHTRNITVGAILGAGLLGSLIAFGQDTPLQRPRAVMPPPLSETAPSAAPDAPVKNAAPIAPGIVPEVPPLPNVPQLPSVPPLPSVPEPKSSIEPVQYTEPKVEKKSNAADLKDLLPKAPALPVIGETPVGVPLAPPLPPVAPSNELAAPPLPQPPKIEPSKTLEPAAAPPKAWSPNDTPVAPEIKTPAPPPTSVYAPIENAPPRSVPTVPVSNPTDMPPEGTSRFVVPPRSSVPVQNTAPQVAPTVNEQPAVPPGPYRFAPVRVNKGPEAPRIVPGPLPKLTETPRQPIVEPRPLANDPPLLGTVTPQLTVEKRGPLLHKVGGPLRYQIVLKNVGSVMAQQVRVEDEVPGALLIATTPIITQQQGDRLVWILPSLRPGEEKTFMEELQPIRSGDVVSTTSVQVYASTSFRTKIDGDIPAPNVTPPSLTQQAPSLPPSTTMPSPFPPAASPFTPPSVQATPTVNNPAISNPVANNPSVIGPSLNPLPDAPPANPIPSAPPQIVPTPPTNPAATTPVAPPVTAGPMPMIVEVKALPSVGLGQKLVFEVLVANKGATPLNKMILYVKVPTGFTHPEGKEIYADLPDMLAGESKSYKVPLQATVAGRYTVEIRVTAAPGYELVARPVVTVESSGLSIQQSSSPFLQMGRDNEIKIVVANNQANPLSQVQVVDVLPEGLEFVAASDRGLYQSANRTITWVLDSVPAGRARTVSLRVQPKSIGSFPHEVIAKTEDLAEAKSTSVYQVESASNLHLQVQDRDDPLEEGKETIYQVRVTNVGSSVATNVQTSITLSPGLDATGFAQAPTAYRVSGRDVIFAPIPRIQPGESKTITLGVRGVISGQQSVRVQVVGEQLRAPLVREERTQVYREK